MKKTLRLLVLVAVVGATALLSSNTAQAAYYPNCESQHGRSCQVLGYVAHCWWVAAQEPSVCVCQNYQWNCFLG